MPWGRSSIPSLCLQEMLGVGFRSLLGGDGGSGDKSTAWNRNHAKMSFGRSPKWRESCSKQERETVQLRG